jgi:uncharacterized protein (DUF2062 family)
MGWAIAVSFAIGVICAMRMPVLIFTFVVLVVIIAYAIASCTIGSPFAQSLAWGLAFAAVLEAGYLSGHGILFSLYSRRTERGRRRLWQKLHSKYSAD